LDGENRTEHGTVCSPTCGKRKKEGLEADSELETRGGKKRGGKNGRGRSISTVREGGGGGGEKEGPSVVDGLARLEKGDRRSATNLISLQKEEREKGEKARVLAGTNKHQRGGRGRGKRDDRVSISFQFQIKKKEKRKKKEGKGERWKLEEGGTALAKKKGEKNSVDLVSLPKEGKKETKEGFR